MEEDQEHKHACKLCNKSFPCGRSLGGHMRSHVINSTNDHQKLKKKKLSSLKNGGINTKPQLGIGYVLRENPKKTCKFVDSSEDTLLHEKEKLCKECGKSFQSWKALFGHMKCHSERFSNSVEEEDYSRDSWVSANHKLVMDSQSDNETAVPNKGKRSTRRVATRYMSTTTSSSLSVANASFSSVSVIEQEQEEVAMCLMMLSRDLGHWGGFNNSVGESSDNNSEFFEAKSLIQTKRATIIEGKKTSLCGVGEIVKFKKLTRSGKIESTCLDSENSKFDAKKSKSEAQINGFLGNNKFKKSTKKESEIELGKNLINEAELCTNNHSSRKRKFDSFDPELVKKCTNGTSDTDKYKDFENKSKFECTTCNKTFHSYQALGGHRASHKKIKGCSFASKVDSNENSIETEVSPNPNDDTKLMNCFQDREITAIDQDQELILEKAETSDGLKKISKGHECSICFKVFSSGQALGGHKRSHLIAEAKSNQSNIVIQKPVQEIRDLLDLNLPPVEEETNGLNGFKPWWVGSNHKPDPLVGLISN